MAEHEQRPQRASTRARGQFVNYGVSNGLQAREFNLGAWYQSTSGELFFGGLNGFNAFVPDRIRQLAQAPPVVLTAVSVDHRPAGRARRRDAEHPARLPRQGAGPRVRGPRLHRPRPQPVLVQARGLRPRVGAPERAAQRHLHEPQPRPLHLPPARRQQRRPLEREGPVRRRWTWRRRPGPRPGPSPATRCSWSGAMLGMARIQKRKFDREAEYARVLEFRVQERTRELSERQRRPGEGQRRAGAGQHHRLADRPRQPPLPDRVHREGSGAAAPPVQPPGRRARSPPTCSTSPS